MLRQEVKVILDTLEQQRSLITKLQCSSGAADRKAMADDVYRPRSISRLKDEWKEDDLTPADGSAQAPNDSTGAQDLLVSDTLALINKRIQKFEEIIERASDLEVWVSRHLFSSPSLSAIFLFSSGTFPVVILTLLEHLPHQLEP